MFHEGPYGHKRNAPLYRNILSSYPDVCVPTSNCYQCYHDSYGEYSTQLPAVTW